MDQIIRKRTFGVNAIKEFGDDLVIVLMAPMHADAVGVFFHRIDGLVLPTGLFDIRNEEIPFSICVSGQPTR